MDSILLPEKEKIQADILLRLKKIEGQVRGIRGMVEQQRDCADVVTQLAAVKAAVNRVGFTVLACEMETIVNKKISGGITAEEAMKEFTQVLKKFS